MANRLLQTEVALTECELHLNNTSAIGTPIESYLTEHLLVLFAREVQQSIYSIVDQSAAEISHNGVKRFVSEACKKIVRGIKKDQLTALVKMYGDALKKTEFDRALNDRETTLYGNVVQERNDVAHMQGATVTFREIKEGIKLARRLLDALEKALV
jgi:hypothetical protein